MSNEMKSFMFLVFNFTVLIMTIASCTSYSNYLETTRFKECITAGYEWVHINISHTSPECRKVNK
jgi:hypothetical protein